MQVSVENTSTLERKLTVVIPKDVVRDYYEQRISRLGREIKLDGFRPGKVPRKVLEKRFAKAIHAEAVNEVINKTYKEAIAAEQLEPVGMPTIQDIKAELNTDVEYVALLEVYPEIVIRPFNELSVEKRTASLTDADVDAQIVELKKKYAEYETVERAATEKDRVVVNYVRTVDEKESDKRDGVYFDLSSEALFDDIKKGLVGMKAEDNKVLTLKFPDDVKNKELASKPYTLDVTIVKVETPKAMSDEQLVEKLNPAQNPEQAQLAQDATQAAEGDSNTPATAPAPIKQTFAEFKEKLKENLASELVDAIQSDLQERVLEKLVEANAFEVPKALVQEEKKAMFQEARAQMEQGRMPSFDINEVDEMAHRRVVLGLLLNAIIRSENITVDGAKVRAEIEKIAKRFGFGDPSFVINAYYKNKELLSTVERSVLLAQAVERVVAQANVTEKTTTFKELTTE